MTNPQQTISDVTIALRPALLTAVAAGFTYTQRINKKSSSSFIAHTTWVLKTNETETNSTDTTVLKYNNSIQYEQYF